MTQEENAKEPYGPESAPKGRQGSGPLYQVWKYFPLLLLLVLVLVAMVLGAGIGRERERLAAEKASEIKSVVPPANVVVQRLVPVTVEDRLSLPATVEPWTDLELLAQIHGRVVEIPVKLGDRVAAGDVIARVDPRDYELAVTSARAAFELARAERSRIQDIFERGLVSRAEMDRAASQFDAQEAALHHAEIQLERCTIAAPLSGTLNRLDIDVGTLLKDGDPVGQIYELGRVKIVVGIPESDVDPVRTLEKIEVIIPALGDRRVIGRPYALTSDSKSLARLYRLELEVRNPDGKILPSMFGRAEVVKSRVPDSVAIPLYSVIARNNENFVYVVNDSHAVRREVELGILDGWMIQITKGLKPGDRVLVVGHRNVNEGQEVSVVREVTEAEDILR